jgi:toxin ParE1/3/4
MRASLSREALQDAEAAADWYLEQGAPDAAERLVAQIGAAVSRLLLTPGLGTPAPHHTRKLPLHGFPMSLVYRVQGEEIRVIAVAAHRRRPTYWRRRV